MKAPSWNATRRPGVILPVTKHVLGLAALLLTTGAFAAEVSGTWVGKVQTDITKFPEKYRAQVKEGLAKTKLSITFKANHTFTSTGSGPDGKAHVSTGSWKQTGNSVTITTKTYDGKPRTGDPARTLALSRDGKTLVMKMDTKTNQKTGTTAPSVQIIFTKKA